MIRSVKMHMKMIQKLVIIEFILMLMLLLTYNSCWADSEILNERDIDAKWLAYKTKHNKTHHHLVDDLRKDLFISTDSFIESHNKHPNSSYKMAHNNFSDMTDHEKRQHLGVSLPDGRRRHIINQLSNVETSDLMIDRASPPSLDYRQLGCLQPVRNQGSCGSCWTFSTIAVMEHSYCMKHGSPISLSEQQLVDCYGGNGCNGGWPNSAFAFFQSNELSMKLSDYPYTGKYSGVCNYDSSKGVVQVKNHGAVQPMNIAGIIDALNQYGILSVAIVVETPLYSYQSGVYSTTCTSKTINHAVVLVGYNTALNFWIVRNSWGPGWGEGGYVRMQMGVNLCQIESFAYWVQVA